MKQLILILCAGFYFVGASGSSVVGSKHDLTVNGGSSYKAVSEKNSCGFCHTPHHSNGELPLWNHAMSSVSNYVVYGSARLTNLNLTIPQPNGSSRLCLSCHDGTVALGNITSGAPAIAMQGTVTTLPASDPANLGTDLRSDHPISFTYDDAMASRDSADIKLPNQWPAVVKLDALKRMQCTSCHNPHDNQNTSFLVMANTGSALCLACHQSSTWSSSPHALSATPVPAAIAARLANAKVGSKIAAATTSASSVKPMSVVGCENCHMNHKASSRMHLLQSAAPEQNCLNCHNGVTVKKNLAADFQKSSIHPITLNSTAHSPAEDPINPKTRHVVCTDCHNPHAATAATALAPNAPGALAKLTGVSAAGGIIKPLLKEYELCFRCHADSIVRGPVTVPRQFTESNTRLQFSAGNQSYHPVEAIGKNSGSVPSLIAPWKTSSVMYCTDCHNSDSGPGAGGTGAAGPHGSIYRPILERNLNLTDGQPESAFAYALCYKCHSRSTVLSGASFRLHQSHVVNDKAACTTCHDSHGVANTPHLINFNSTYVTNGSLGTVSYLATGIFKGNCTLSCHGVDHKNTAY